MIITKKRLLHGSIAISLIIIGILGLSALTARKKELAKEKPDIPVPTVRTIRVETENLPMCIKGEGTVRPLREINLVPQVGGKIVYMSERLVNGGAFLRGDILLRIDPVDYELAVTLAEAQVRDAESLLKLTEEEAAAAKEEWRIHYADDSDAGEEPPPLVAKEPQLAAAEARLAAARAELRKARLHLERTELRAPFEGRVSQENVDIGQYVSPGQTLASLYSTEAAEIYVPLEKDDLFWFYVPGLSDGNSLPPPALVHAEIAGKAITWPGKVVRAEGKVDERTRMIRVVVRVEKPYEEKPPLVVGLFVTVDIQGDILPNAVTLPRSALRQDNIVWVVNKENRLKFRPVEVAKLQGEQVIIASGLKDGESVVVSPLKAVTDGMRVRTLSLPEENPS